MTRYVKEELFADIKVCRPDIAVDVFLWPEGFDAPEDKPWAAVWDGVAFGFSTEQDAFAALDMIRTLQRPVLVYNQPYNAGPGLEDNDVDG